MQAHTKLAKEKEGSGLQNCPRFYLTSANYCLPLGNPLINTLSLSTHVHKMGGGLILLTGK